MIYGNQKLESSVAPTEPGIRGVQQGAALQLKQKELNERARATNVAANIAREKMAAQDENYARLNASRERMQLQAQQFQAEQSQLDRDAREELAQRALLLENERHMATIKAAGAQGTAALALEAEIAAKEAELDKLGIAAFQAELASTKDSRRYDEITARAVDEATKTQESIRVLEDAAQVGAGEVQVGLADAVAEEIRDIERIAANLGIVTPALGFDLIPGADVLPESVREGAMAEAVEGQRTEEGFFGTATDTLVKINQWADRTLNTVIDSVTGDERIYDSREAQDVRTRLEELRDNGGNRLLAGAVAGVILDRNPISQGGGDEVRQTREVTEVELTNAIASALNGKMGSDQFQQRLEELEVDTVFAGNLLYEVGRSRREALTAISAADTQTEEGLRTTAVPNILRKGGARAEVLGREIRGMTSERYGVFIDGIRGSAYDTVTDATIDLFDDGFVDFIDDQEFAGLFDRRDARGRATAERALEAERLEREIARRGRRGKLEIGQAGIESQLDAAEEMERIIRGG